MISRAVEKYLRVSPRKLRVVTDLVRNKNIPMARAILESCNKQARVYVRKAVDSAVANAKRFPNTDENNLFISRIFIDQGPTLKRFRARALGMATMVRKRSSHLTIELDALEKPIKGEGVKKKAKVLKEEKPAVQEGKAEESKEPAEEKEKRTRGWFPIKPAKKKFREPERKAKKIRRAKVI